MASASYGTRLASTVGNVSHALRLPKVSALMKQLWLVLVFLVLMLLIGRGWQGEPVTAGVAASGTIPSSPPQAPVAERYPAP